MSYQAAMHPRHEGIYSVTERTHGHYIATHSTATNREERVAATEAATEESELVDDIMIMSTVNGEGEHVAMQCWNPFRAPVAAAIMGGVDRLNGVAAGATVLYLADGIQHGDALNDDGETASHLADMVGEGGKVLVASGVNNVEREAAAHPHIELLTECSSTNMTEVTEHPSVKAAGLVDCIVADINNPSQGTMLAELADSCLRNDGGLVVVSDAAALRPPSQDVNDAKKEDAAVLFAAVVQNLRDTCDGQVKPQEQITLEPFFQDAAVLVCKMKAKLPDEMRKGDANTNGAGVDAVCSAAAA